jgi:hypothetical protein
MARRSPPRKVTYFEPVAPRLARNTVIESTFEVGRRFRWTMRVDCGQLDPGAVIRPDPGEWHPRMPERLDEDELADWRAGRCPHTPRHALRVTRIAPAPQRLASRLTSIMLNPDLRGTAVPIVASPCGFAGHTMTAAPESAVAGLSDWRETAAASGSR